MTEDRWHDGSAYEAYVGRWSRLVAERFVSWLGLGRGGSWVDVGCGTGALSRAIIDLAEPARVVGIDPSPAFLAAARTKLPDPRVRFIEGSGGALPIANASADAVVSGLVLNFLLDLPTALADMRRVALPGRTVAAYVWDYGGEMQLLRRFWDAAVALDPMAEPLHEGTRFPICHPDALEGAYRRAGFEDVVVVAIDVPTVFRDFDDYWAPFLSGVGPAPGYVASLDGGSRRRLRDRLEQTLPREETGTIRLTARAWAVRARA